MPQVRRAHLLSFFLTLLLILNPAAGCLPLIASEQETSKSFILDNGLRVFLLEKRDIPLVNAVAAVNLGVKDETEEISGLAHLLEHYVLFRGTERRSGSEISRQVRQHGAYFNAHTGHDLTLFEIVVPSEHILFALRNQKEILFDLKLSQAGLDEEKEVIFEELRELEDDPFRYATSLVYQNLFQGHPYGKPVEGKKETIQALTVKMMEDFYRRFFVPDNCTLAVVGDFDLNSVEKEVRAVFEEVKVAPVQTGQREKIEIATPLGKAIDLDVELDVNKAYLVIGFLAPDYNHPDQYSFDLLTEILGRGLSPMLHSALRGQRRLAETVYMSYNALKYGGAALVYLTLDPKDIQAAKRETLGCLRRVRNENFSPDDHFGEARFSAFDFLGGAKNKVRYNAYQAMEKGLSLARALAQHLILSSSDKPLSYLENIERITSSDLRKVAAAYLSRSEYVAVSAVPKKNAKK